MKAFIVTPGRAGSGHLADIPEPIRTPREALVAVVTVGVDGTDRELMAGAYGEAPPGDDYLVIGHESLGRVVEAPSGSLQPGELVVAIVRRPDPVPCLNCAAGEWDMCLNGRYTERGIKGRHGFLVERYAEDPLYLIAVPERFADVAVLLEPLSIVEKAIEQIKRIQQRLAWAPHRALVLGAGTIGALAALLLRLDGLTVYLHSKGDGGPGWRVAQAVDAAFTSADERPLDRDLAMDIGPLDIVIEATGYSPLAFAAMDIVGPNGVVCLTGVSAGSRALTIDASRLNLELVLQNKVVFGTVNANRRHFENGVRHLQAIEQRWPGLLEKVITRRVTLEQFCAADLDRPRELKVVVDVNGSQGLASRLT